MIDWPFEEDLARVQTFEDLATFLNEQVRAQGFKGFTYVCQFQLSYLSPPVIICASLDPEWTAHYMANAYASVDPLIQAALRSTRPWFWSVEDDWTRFGQGVSNFQSDLKDWGFRQGVCLPFRALKGLHGFCNLIYEDIVDLQARVAQIQFLLPYVHPQTTKIYMAQYPQSIYHVTLTPREREIFTLIAEGLTSQQIADQLHLAKRTVETHIGAVQNKLEAENRIQALIKAINMWLVQANTLYRREDNAEFFFSKN